MIPIPFAEQNRVWKGTPESGVLDLPAYTDDRVTISCWKMTWAERITLFLTGRLWLSQMNFSRPLQPQKLSAENPFAVPQ